jgi:hypothetical protein
MSLTHRLLALLVVPAQLLFVAGALVGGLAQGPGYSPVRHDISDLGALTARHPWFELGPEGFAGVVTVAFSLVVLRQVLSWLASALLAGSLMGLDSLSDLVFRLDCVSADHGCTDAVRLGSWHAQVHAAVGLVSAVASVVALVLVARRLRVVEGWQDLARPTQWCAGLLAGALLAYAALEGRAGGGVLERLAVGAVIVALSALAHRALRLGRRTGPGTAGVAAWRASSRRVATQ